MGVLQNAGIFLVQTLFDCYAMILLLRILLQYLRVDYYNPMSQFIIKATNPAVVPLRQIIPGYWGLDLATVAVLAITLFLKIVLLVVIGMQKFPAFGGLLVWTLGDATVLLIKLFFYAILLQILLSWLQPLSGSPLRSLLEQLTAPLLIPARKKLYRLFPSLSSGIDLSPIPVMIALQLGNLLLAQPLVQVGTHLAIR